jgi:4-amino-4-deoxy-L-arabinose transferase-like glycosyltransferase
MRKSNVALFIIGPLVALTAYLYGLDSIHIPKIGDEPPYLQIARVTAESGRMLPLVWDRGINNTKPPMLFWQGILTSGWGKYWNPWTLRGPIVLYSFAIALLIGLFTRKLSGDARTGLVAGLIYLGFLSTIQHGRPFLTNAPETLFLFLPLVIMFQADSTTVRNTLLCGFCFGMAALYKSFFLIFVGAFALGLVLLYRADFKPLAFLKRYGVFFTGAVLLGLGVFSLWLVFDPYPEKVLSQFLMKENVGKFNLTNFWTGLYSGSYALWRLWLGDFANAGLYAVVLLGLVIDTVRRRKQLAPHEKQLWLYVLGFLIIYSIPTQRQENYILPTCAALSVLLALRWQALPAVWFRITLVVAAFMFLVTFWVQWEVEHAFGARLFSWKNYLVPLLLFALSLFSLARIEVGRFLLPLIALGALLTASLFLDPFSRKYSEEARRELQGKTVYFPSRPYLIKHELYRFLLPGANVVGYTKQHPLEEIDHTYCARIIDLDEEIPEGYRLIDQVYNLKTRHTNQQIKDMIFHRRLELMLDRLALLEKKEG